MVELENETVRIKAKNYAQPKVTDFEIVKSKLSTELKDNEIIVKSLHISVDPYLIAQFKLNKIGQSIYSGIVGEIIHSTSKDYKIGTIVNIKGSWSLYNKLTIEKKDKDEEKKQQDVYIKDVYTGEYKYNTFAFIPKKKQVEIIDEDDKNLLSYYLGTLGMVGLTAYAGFYKILATHFVKNKKQTLAISSAAGAVGSILGQIAKNEGFHVIGIAGSDDKVKFMKDTLGFDAAFNYKQFQGNREKRIKEALVKVAPNGIDLYFDNTGGFVSEAITALMTRKSKVAVCGQIAYYNNHGVKVEPILQQYIYKNVTAEGFVQLDYLELYPELRKKFKLWIKEKKLVVKETKFKGIAKVADAFVQLFTSRKTNIGKLVVDI